MLLFGCSQSLGLCPCSSRSRILKSNPARCFHSEIQRYAPKKVLERNSYEVISVTTIGEAVRALHQFPICATVADHLLERATGAQLARDMKKIKPEIPIILFSGDIPENLDGVDVYLNKAEPTAKFLETVRGVVERSRL